MMKKKILILGVSILLIIMVFISCGCTSTDDEQEKEEAGKSLDFKIGEMYYTDYLISDTGYTSTPSKNYKWFIIELTIKNNGESDTSVNPNFFTLEDTSLQTYTYDWQSYSLPDAMTHTEIAAGSSYTSKFIFEMLKDITPSNLIFDNYKQKKEIPITTSNIKSKYNTPPKADAGQDQTVFIDEEITLDGSKSSDNEGGNLDFEWDYGDDTSYTGYKEIETHTYREVGKFTVTLTLTDGCDLSDTDTLTITVKHYFELTVNDHGWHETLDPFDYHNGDYEVEITLKNVSPETQEIWGTFFELITSDEVGYDWGGDDGNSPDSLGGGSSATWTIYFDVPEEKTPVKIVYDDILEENL